MSRNTWPNIWFTTEAVVHSTLQKRRKAGTVLHAHMLWFLSGHKFEKMSSCCNKEQHNNSERCSKNQCDVCLANNLPGRGISLFGRIRLNVASDDFVFSCCIGFVCRVFQLLVFVPAVYVFTFEHADLLYFNNETNTTEHKPCQENIKVTPLLAINTLVRYSIYLTPHFINILVQI